MAGHHRRAGVPADEWCRRSLRPAASRCQAGRRRTVTRRTLPITGRAGSEHGLALSTTIPLQDDGAAVIFATAPRPQWAHTCLAGSPLNRVALLLRRTAVMGAFDLPPAFVPIGLSGIVGLLVATLVARAGGRRKRRRGDEAHR